SKNILKLVVASVVVGVLLIIPKNTDLSYGYSWENPPEVNKPWICMNSAPDKVILYQPGHPLLPKSLVSGEVRLNWLKVSNADKYTVAYGVQPGTYIYGVNNVGNSDNFTVSYLNPGQTYYFVVRGVNGCKPGAWSQEWSAVAPGTGRVSYTGGTTTGGTLPPVVSPAPKTTVQQPKKTDTQPTVTPSPKTGYQAPVGTPPTVNPPTMGFWQKVGNWFSNIFK
ncbi:fibronectin type III domain-containing protein, partial [Patescibacteria group bacterium]|nr:fibronectin type III domain-containing protein [Patescibacteria group bacterium]